MGSPSFADVLAEALRVTARPPAAPSPVAAQSAPSCVAAAPPHPFLFGAMPALARAQAAFAFDAAARRFPPRPRPVRALTAGQHHSVEVLNALGAQLASGFTGQELRQAYRSIAYRVHPDRHHDCGEAERARRARLFVAATAHYHRLRALVDAR